MKPSNPPTRGKAILCLLLNLIVLPGLGTWLGGGRHRRAGWTQMILSIILLPLLVSSAIIGAISSGLPLEKLTSGMSLLFVILFIWSAWSGLHMIREARRTTLETASAPTPGDNQEQGRENRG